MPSPALLQPEPHQPTQPPPPPPTSHTRAPHCAATHPAPPPPTPPPQATGELSGVGLADWTPQTIDSWRHSIWVGVWDPWIVVLKGPRMWYKVRPAGASQPAALDGGQGLERGLELGLGQAGCPLSAPPAGGTLPFISSHLSPPLWLRPQVTREIVTLERMHRAFADGLMEVRVWVVGGGGGAVGQRYSGRQAGRHGQRQGTGVLRWSAPPPLPASDMYGCTAPSAMQYGMMKATKKKA